MKRILNKNRRAIKKNKHSDNNKWFLEIKNIITDRKKSKAGLEDKSGKKYSKKLDNK